MSKTIPSQDLRRSKLEADPTCSKCGLTKTIDDFALTGVDYWCLSCRNEYAKSLYRKKRESMTDAEWKAYRKRLNEKQKRNRQKRIECMKPKELRAFREKERSGNAERRKQVRHEVYMAYGGYCCACCGESEPAFLSIDHVNNDGAEHKRRENLVTGEQMYRWLKRHGFPPGFQILCMNCQWGKRNNNGVCPHQVRCNDHPDRE